MRRKVWCSALCLILLSVCTMLQAASVCRAQNASDVSPLSIVTPPVVIEIDSTYTPSVIITNHGPNPVDSIQVICMIDSFADTMEVLDFAGVNSLDSVTVDFSPWTVPDTVVGSYTATVFTRCETDTYPANDTVSKSLYLLYAQYTDTITVVSDTGSTNQTVRVPIHLVNPHHTLGGISFGVFLNTTGLAEFDSADYGNSCISDWEWRTSHSPSATTIYLDAIAEDGMAPFTPPLAPSSQRRLLAELVVRIDPDAPGTILPHDWSDFNNDMGVERWMRDETNPKSGDASASVEVEPFWPSDDWLLTPQFLVSSDDSLKFWYRAEDESYPESLEVRLSTTTIDIDSFAVVLWAVNLTNTDYVEQKIDLAPHAGESCYAAFVYRSQDKQGLYIDDVSLPSALEGFEEASTLMNFSVASFLVDSSGYVYYYPIRESGVLYVAGEGLCGDANGDGRITVADATYIVGYIYRNGPAPVGQGDVNLDGRVTVADATYIVGFVYRSGPAPCEPAGYLNLERKGGGRE